MSAVAVIPARGGSKGVPRKNLQRVGGRSLVARAVAAAQRAGVSLVVVSTDDAEIGREAESAGADVVWRPDSLSGDTASSESAILHALDSHDGAASATTIAFLQATSPFISAEALRAAVERVEQAHADVVFAVAESHAFLWREEASGLTGVNHDHRNRPRRQDRTVEYVETGAFYVMSGQGFREARHRFFGRTAIAVVPAVSAVEVDTPEDLAVAQSLAHLLDQPEPVDAHAVVTDFDGVHTDDRAWVDENGREMVAVSRSDGLGVERLRRLGVPCLILSKETNPVVSARGRKLQVEVSQGVDDKAAALAAWIERRGLGTDGVAYLGNDVNDLPAMELVGWPIAVADAHPAVRRAARRVLAAPGGAGAVRELCDLVAASRRDEGNG